MKSTTFAGATAYLIQTPPDWASPVRLSVDLPSEVETGISGHETRRGKADTLRLALEFSGIVELDELLEWRNALAAISTEKVLCPLWPAVFAAGATPPVTADFYAVEDGAGGLTVAANASRPFAYAACPLLVGRLAKPPDVVLINDQCARVSVQFVEDGLYPVTTPAFTPPDGPDTTPAYKLFPWRANWGDSPRSGSAEADLNREDVGDGRETQSAYWTAPPRRRVEAIVTLVDSEPWQFLAFLASVGSTGAFWVPAGISEAVLADDVAAVDETLTCDRTSNAEYVLLDDTVNRVPLVVSDASAVEWALAAAVGTAFTADITRVEGLILSRLDRPSAVLRFDDRNIVQTSIQTVEVPLETAAQSGETLGTTMGTLPVTSHLYEFSIAYPGSTETFRYTSFERNLTYGGNTYYAQPFEHDSILQTATMERQSVSLRSRHFSGNPLSKCVPFALEWPLQLKIIECTVSSSAATAVETLFVGEVTELSADGPFLKVTAESLFGLFQRRIPRRVMEPGCNWCLFDSACGLVKTSWKWTATVLDWFPATLALSLQNVAPVSPTGAETLLEHYLAGGYLTIGAGTSQQYRLIADNYGISGGTFITIVLAMALSPDPGVGATVYFYPGCDLRAATCASKFNNFSNFGGFPFMPVGNPSMVKVSKNVTTGGKK